MLFVDVLEFSFVVDVFDVIFTKTCYFKNHSKLWKSDSAV